MAAGAAARLWRLGLPALSSDEAFSWRLARYPLGELVRRTADDVHSPLWYLLLKAWLPLAGESATALRALSVLLGLAAVALTYLLVREATRPRGPGGALLAAALVALHPLQVQQGRNARMYALGTALAALTAWLLLRALRRGGAASWAGYGAAAAAFVYAHYYALFTLLAQAVGAALLWHGRLREHASDDEAASDGPAGRPVPLRWPALAGGVALLLFLPWLPSFLVQARRVQEEYWIPPVSAGALRDALLHWATGLGASPAAWSALAVLAVAVAWGCARAPRVSLFFAAQAVLPWLLALAVALLGHRPLLLERFTVFAQVGLIALVGVAVSRLPRAPGVALAALLAGAAALGLAGLLRALPADPPATAQVARVLRRGAQAGDAVVVDSPRALNKMLFYLQQEGVRDLPVLSLPGVAGGEHYTHAASLRPGEQVERVEEAARGGGRLWRAPDKPYPVPPAPPFWTLGYARVFDGGEGSKALLVRYDPGS